MDRPVPETATFFEQVYASADDEAAIPWQQAISRRLIADWLGRLDPAKHRRALVVAAGLGDDAAALAELGLEVTAFDFSPTAVRWAGERHADLDIDWHVADLFDLPSEWAEAFDLVVEVFTIQSIEPARQPDAARAIARLLSPGGTLAAVTLTYRGDQRPDGPPWPLHPSTVDILADGLRETHRFSEELGGGLDHSLDSGLDAVLIEWVRPTA